MDNNYDKAFGAVIFGLVISILGNVLLFLELKKSEFSIETKDRHIATKANEAGLYKQDVVMLLKKNDDLKATLAECNAALASVQAKPVAVPTVCPAIPLAPTCPEAPACPAVPVVTCPAIPKPAATPIATPVPARIIYKYIHHRVHYRKPAAKPDCDKYND